MDIEYSLKQIDLLNLDSKSQVLFSPLIKTPEKLFKEKLSPGDLLLSYAVFHKDVPVGICYGYAYPSIQQGFIRELVVLKEHCGKGIGTKLLSSLTDLYKKSGINYITWQFESSLPGLESLEKILSKQGWATPQVILERYFFYSATFSPDWYKAEEPKLPKGYRIFPWIGLKKKEKELVKNLILPNSVLEDISPFDRTYPMEPLNSLGLRYKDEIVGWMITDRIDNDTISYTSLYIHPELRGLGPAIALLKESIRRQIDAKIKIGVTQINLKRTPKYWQQFVKKRLAPQAYQKQLLLFSHISL